jgi:hypothetical protein
MKSNLQNIQKFYSEIPSVWVYDNVPYQGYEHFTELHYEHGWRDVKLPEFNSQTHKLSDVFVLLDDVVTKEVIELTDEELKAIEKSKVPFSVKNIQLRKALIQFGIMPSTITAALYNLPNETEKEKITRELMINLWEYEDEMRRASPDIIGFGANFGLFEKELDNLFILASTL